MDRDSFAQRLRWQFRLCDKLIERWSQKELRIILAWYTAEITCWQTRYLSQRDHDGKKRSLSDVLSPQEWRKAQKEWKREFLGEDSDHWDRESEEEEEDSAEEIENMADSMELELS